MHFSMAVIAGAGRAIAMCYAACGIILEKVTCEVFIFNVCINNLSIGV